MIVSTALLTSMSALMRTQMEELHPLQLAFFRNFFGLILLLPFLWRAGLASIKTSHWGLMTIRGVFNAVAMLLFFTALNMLPLADISALSFTTPLFVALMAIPFLGERLGPRRIASLVIGFGGALIIIRPGFEAVNIGAVLTIVSVAAWAVAVVAIKILSRTDSSVTITLYGMLFLTVFTFPPALFVWQWPSLEATLVSVAAAGAGTLGQVLFAQAMRNADATLVMPFDFTKLIWAALFGYLLFAEIPTIWTWLGGAVIFASATYQTYRERDTTKPLPPVVTG